MKGKLLALSAAASLLCATAAWPADFQVKRSLELPASTPQVWHLIGDFCDIDDWHPDVSACALKVVDGALVRVLTMGAGDIGAYAHTLPERLSPCHTCS